jgi:hypothetical protein
MGQRVAGGRHLRRCRLLRAEERRLLVREEQEEIRRRHEAEGPGHRRLSDYERGGCQRAAEAGRRPACGRTKRRAALTVDRRRSRRSEDGVVTLTA